MNDKPYGIDIENANKRAIELIPDDFFWDCTDELAPFGSDEGDTALAEFREWREANPSTPTLACLQWTIEGVGEMEFADYNESLLSPEKIKSQIKDEDFDDQQYIFTLDVSVIATGFGQLVDEGIIDIQNKPVISIALDRQIIWAECMKPWEHADRYIANLQILKQALVKA
jgi:uncharacterized protein YfeS